MTLLQPHPSTPRDRRREQRGGASPFLLAPDSRSLDRTRLFFPGPKGDGDREEGGKREEEGKGRSREGSRSVEWEGMREQRKGIDFLLLVRLFGTSSIGDILCI